MTSEGLGEMFEGDPADICAGKCSQVSMGGRANELACADLGARIPIGASGNCSTPTHKALNLPHSRRFLPYLNLSFKATQKFKINMQPKYAKFNCIF